MKDEITSSILNDLTEKLDYEQLKLLESSLIRNLYNVEISEANTQLSTSCVDNDIALQYYIMSLTVEQHSTKTMAQYQRHVRSLFDFLNKDFRDITSEDIKYYLAIMSKTRHWKASTTNNTRKFIKTFFAWANENEYISKDPFVKIKSFKTSQPMKCTLSETEVEAIRDKASTPSELAIVDFLNATGLRVSELCLLDRNDIDFQTGTVSVYAPKTKTHRTVFMDAKAQKHLADYYAIRTDQNPSAFATDQGVRIYPNKIEMLLRKLSASAGITKHVTVHTFRKTLASRLFRRHVDLLTIATILGHSSTATTEKYYISVDSDAIHHQYNLMI